MGASYFHEKGSQRTPAQFDERAVLARLAGVLNGPIPGRPGTDPLPASLLANTAFTGALLQGVAGASGIAIPAPLASAIAANLQPAQIESATNFSRTKAIDLFADVTFRVAEQFEVGGGIRYTSDDKRSGISAQTLSGRSILGGFIGALSQPAAVRTQLLTALAAPGAATIPPSAQFPVPVFGLSLQSTANNGDVAFQENDDSGLTYRATARFIPNDDSSLYATYSRGRRPELLSALPPGAPGGAARFSLVDAETVDSFEVGAKTAIGGRMLTLDGALFYYKYNNFQTTEQDGVLFVTTNAGEAESYGFEGQFVYRPVEWARLFGTYAYNHSRFETGLREGNRFRLSPDHSASLGARLSFPAGGGAVEFTPTVTYQSRIFFDDDNDRPELQQAPQALIPDLIQDEVQDGYLLVNARLGYSFAEGAFRLEGFVNNLFDERYIKDAGNTGDALGLPTFIAGEPRFYGVQLSARFGENR